MKYRPHPAVSLHQPRPWCVFWLLALVLALAGPAFAQDAEDPPGRVGVVSFRQGGVVFAPEGEEEWTDLPANRPITSGDRLWTDHDARAEFHVGTTTLHLGGEAHLGVSDLEERALKVILLQGSLNVRVREVAQGENVEVDTPNLAFRALQPGDYRVDVDARSGETRVTVQGGLGSVFGEAGQAMHMGAGQSVSFAGRSLEQGHGPEFRQDEFGLWAAERNRAEDHSVSARYVPRGVVGYAQLDPYGTWNQDPTYGAVWYPTVQVANWAPYRYGHWSWISPWGWTWIDDAPWGFAPFHYGRWTMISNRWAWVPGRLAHRPVYSPALVVFLGGGATRLAIGSGPAVGWYPLAPGEAWWPTFRHSPRYIGFANYNINLNAYPRHFSNHVWRQRPFAVTAVGEDDFRRGRPVYRHWQPLAPHTMGNAQIHVVPVRPELRHRGEFQRSSRSRLDGAPPAGVRPPQQGQHGQPVQPRFGGRRDVPPGMHEVAPGVREGRPGAREVPPGVREVPPGVREARPGVREVPPDVREVPHDVREVAPGVREARPGMRELPPGVRDQFRARREQDRLQQEAGRGARDQQRQAEAARTPQDDRAQREQAIRQQQEQAARWQAQRGQQDQGQREAQREAWRQQREQNAAPGSTRQFVQPVRPFVQPVPQQHQPVRPFAEGGRQQHQPVRPFAGSGRQQQAVPVPQQQVQPVQQPQQLQPGSRPHQEFRGRGGDRGDWQQGGGGQQGGSQGGGNRWR